MRQYSKSPQLQKVQVSKPRFRAAPSIGLPSSYPASPTMIAFEQKASDPCSLDPLVEEEQREEEASLMTTSLCSLGQHDSMSSFDTSVLMQSEGAPDPIRTPQQQPRHHRHHHSTPRSTHHSHHRRQRNRAFSDSDFAAIMNDYTANTY